MSGLADRIRGIVAPGGVSKPVASGFSRTSGPPEGGYHIGFETTDIERVLGGQWCDTDGARCFIVERRMEPDTRHGRDAIGTLAEWMDQGTPDAVLFAGGAARAPFVFFDLETTGLSGGAGTHAFLVGCARFDAERGFATKQFLLTRPAHERTLLDVVAGELGGAGALVSFNGKSFDAPLLETRYLFHRVDWSVAGIPHVDALHPARRFWPGDCSLIALERQMLGARRRGDVPQAEIPARYFQFVRSGDARPLAAVLEHNRLDLLTLAALTARLLRLVAVGPAAARDAREMFALGTTYARAGLDDRARDCFARAVEKSCAPSGAFDAVRLDSWRALALAWRRVREFDRAAACWRQILDTRGCPPQLHREAAEALAIHHEHRVRDLDAAKAFALRSLVDEPRPAWTQAVQHRLARLDRKMSVGRLL
jgi:uncharacterized protein YprB with RNaseH-like and TPR domain